MAEGKSPQAHDRSHDMPSDTDLDGQPYEEDSADCLTCGQEDGLSGMYEVLQDGEYVYYCERCYRDYGEAFDQT